MTQPLGPTDNGIVVPTDTNGGAMVAGSPQTTPSTVDQNSVSPNTQYVMPPSNPQPAANPNATPAAGATTASQPKTAQPHPMSRIFDGILRNLSGPVTVTDPVTGEGRDVPQTRGNMGKSILAAALSGLMTPNSYRETPYGPVNDTAGNIASGLKAGQEYQEKRQEKAQKISNEQQAAKLMTITNNFKLVQLQAASAHARHEMLQDNLANAKAFNKPFEDLDALRADNPNVPQAFVANDMSDKQVLSSGHSLSDSNVLMTGTRTVYNEQTGQMEEEPTYGILNPELKDITLPKEVTDKLAEIGSQWQDIHKVVGGNVTIPVNAYVHAMRDYQAVTMGQNTLDTLSKEVGGKPIGRLTAAIKADPRLLSVLYRMTQAGSAGATVNNRPEALLDTIVNTPNGDRLLALMGLDPAKANAYLNKKKLEFEEQESHAKGASKEEIAANNAAAKVAAEEAKQARKDQNTFGYVEDQSGKTLRVSKWDADHNPEKYTNFEEMKPSDVNKDRASIRMLNDVQSNVNYMSQAVDRDLPGVTEADRTALQNILALQEVTQATNEMGGGGIHVSFPTISAQMSADAQAKANKEYGKLSQSAKNMLDAYLRTAASVPAYQKSLTGIGRSNKEMLDLELNNVPKPWMRPDVIRQRLGFFQKNVDQAKAGFPNNLPGVHPQEAYKPPVVPKGKVPAYQNGQVVGYADDNKGTNVVMFDRQ